MCCAQQRARGGPLDSTLAEDGHYSEREEHFKQALAGCPPPLTLTLLSLLSPLPTEPADSLCDSYKE